jgi:hypothetical protein
MSASRLSSSESACLRLCCWSGSWTSYMHTSTWHRYRNKDQRRKGCNLKSSIAPASQNVGRRTSRSFRHPAKAGQSACHPPSGAIWLRNGPQLAFSLSASSKGGIENSVKATKRLLSRDGSPRCFHSIDIDGHYMKSSSLSSCAALSSKASSVNRFSYRFDFFWFAHSCFCRAASLAC